MLDSLLLSDIAINICLFFHSSEISLLQFFHFIKSHFSSLIVCPFHIAWYFLKAWLVFSFVSSVWSSLSDTAITYFSLQSSSLQYLVFCLPFILLINIFHFSSFSFTWYSIFIHSCFPYSLFSSYYFLHITPLFRCFLLIHFLSFSSLFVLSSLLFTYFHIFHYALTPFILIVIFTWIY